MPGPPIEAVIFDYGGVLSLSPFGRLAHYESSLGLAPGTLANLLGYGLDIPEPVDGEPSDNLFHLLEIGAIELDEYAEWVRRRSVAVFGLPVDLAGAMGAGMDGLSVHWMVVHRARWLQEAGYRLAICTNNIAAFREVWQRQIPLALFDAVIDSSDVGVRKPDPAIYLLTCQRLGVEPDRCVFLDDHPGNVAAAVALGMEGIVVDDPWVALAELDDLLMARATSDGARTAPRS